MITIEIANEQSILDLDEDCLRTRIQETLIAQQIDNASLSVALVDDEAIHVINREHLGHDYPTDVISFSYSENLLSTAMPSGNSLQSESESSMLDGELVISVETAQRESKQHGWAPMDELTLYVVHGLLHLCGYDDLSPAERQHMRRREREILKQWGLTPRNLE